MNSRRLSIAAHPIEQDSLTQAPETDHQDVRYAESGCAMLA